MRIIRIVQRSLISSHRYFISFMKIQFHFDEHNHDLLSRKFVKSKWKIKYKLLKFRSINFILIQLWVKIVQKFKLRWRLEMHNSIEINLIMLICLLSRLKTIDAFSHFVFDFHNSIFVHESIFSTSQRNHYRQKFQWSFASSFSCSHSHFSTSFVNRWMICWVYRSLSNCSQKRSSISFSSSWSL